ncbi:unnamed protein product [Urochloa decumbens]|uniref:DUF4408 domain-containing protein n=1 Tax=Urochloa decumbens TaxID=240449 RepID=A0ABC9C673_9POAL
MVMAMWWPLAAWLSPAAAWFVFFNAVVGAIAIMSSAGSSSAQQTPTAAAAAARRRLCRSGSSMLLDRLRSFSIFTVHPMAGGVATGASLDGGDATAAVADAQFYCYGTREAEAAAAARVIAPEQPERGPQAADAPAGATATSSAAPPSAPVSTTPAVEEEHAAPLAPAPESEEDGKAEAQAAEEEGAEHDESISLDEAYALAQRRRTQEQATAPPPPLDSAAAAAPTTATARKKNAAAEGVSRRRRNKAEDAVDGKAELNLRADLFIRQFREELKLQRLNSILSHAQALGSPTAVAR